jgi:hypothetical protein
MISPTQFVGRERAVGCDVGNRQMVFLGCVDIRNSPECPMTARCKNKRGDSALSFRYTRRVGCMVEVDGNWLPEANVENSSLNSSGRVWDGRWVRVWRTGSEVRADLSK